MIDYANASKNTVQASPNIAVVNLSPSSLAHKPMDLYSNQSRQTLPSQTHISSVPYSVVLPNPFADPLSMVVGSWRQIPIRITCKMALWQTLSDHHHKGHRPRRTMIWLRCDPRCKKMMYESFSIGLKLALNL